MNKMLVNIISLSLFLGSVLLSSEDIKQLRLFVTSDVKSETDPCG